MQLEQLGVALKVALHFLQIHLKLLLGCFKGRFLLLHVRLLPMDNLLKASH